MRFLTRWETDRNHRFRYVDYGGDIIRDDYGRGVLFGHSPIGRTRWEVADGDPDDPFWAAHIGHLDSRLPFKSFSYLVRIRSGRMVVAWTNGYPIFENGEFVGYRGTGRFSQADPWAKKLAS